MKKWRIPRLEINPTPLKSTLFLLIFSFRRKCTMTSVSFALRSYEELHELASEGEFFGHYNFPCCYYDKDRGQALQQTDWRRRKEGNHRRRWRHLHREVHPSSASDRTRDFFLSSETPEPPTQCTSVSLSLSPSAFPDSRGRLRQRALETRRNGLNCRRRWYNSESAIRSHLT